MDWLFIVASLSLGVGLAMDAFSVSLANGLNEPKMRGGKICLIAATFAFFQALMPMLGWFLVHTLAEKFTAFQKWIPWIALLLLSFIGGKMLVDGIKHKEDDAENKKTDFATLLLQGVATSIDALSVGFTIASYGAGKAVECSLLIAGITFLICFAGVLIGKKFGTVLADKASIIGGVILISIGIIIFIKNIF